jgi:hypothetical protein
MTSVPALRAVNRRLRTLLGTVLWVGVSTVLGVALTQGETPTALAAAACLVLAAAPVAWGAVAGITFPGRLLTGLLAFNASALLLGEIGGLYVTIWWWDILLHLVASVVLAVLGMALAMMATDGSLGQIGARMLAILAFSFAMMVGAMWELLEFSLDATLGTVTQRSGLPDTMGDIAVNVVGAFLGAVVADAYVIRGVRWPPAGLLEDFMDLNPALYPSRPHRRRVRR